MAKIVSFKINSKNNRILAGRVKPVEEFLTVPQGMVFFPTSIQERQINYLGIPFHPVWTSSTPDRSKFWCSQMVLFFY